MPVHLGRVAFEASPLARTRWNVMEAISGRQGYAWAKRTAGCLDLESGR